MTKGASGLYTSKGVVSPFFLDFSLAYARGTFPGLSMHHAASKTYSAAGLLQSDIHLSVSFATNVVLTVKLDDVSFHAR